MTTDHWQSRCLLTVALLLFLSGQLTKQTSGIQPEGCSKITENSTKTTCACLCDPLFGGRCEINCQVIGTDSTISIRFLWNNAVKITCFRLDLLDYRLLPSFIQNNYSTVSINQCALPPRQPIHRISSKLGLTEVLQLDFNGRGPLERIHFEGQQNLTSLQLNLTDSSHLPEDLFAELGNVSGLQLQGINSINLTSKITEKMPTLIGLRLISNGIVNFLPDVFAFLPHLKTVTMAENHIESLPDGLLAVNKNLLSFILNAEQVQLKRLPGGLLANMPSLQKVRLSCGLETIPEDLFANSKDLWKISIIENNLVDLPPTLFADQIKLYFLSLSGNRLTSLPEDIFRNTTNLQILRLSRNHLVTIGSRILSSLHNLKWLYITNNDLFTLESRSLRRTKKLKFIYLENNRLSDSIVQHKGHLVTPFSHLKELEILVLKNNSIRTLFEDLTIGLRNLRKLDLSHNNITTINNFDLKCEDCNVFVNLSHNSIQKINFNRTCYASKITLDLSDNPIQCDCELLPFVQFLKSQGHDKCISFEKFTSVKFQCSYPQNLEGRTVTTLSPQELLCALDRDPFSAKLCPEECSCLVRPADGTAIVNCSNSNLIEMPILPNLTSPQVKMYQAYGTELYMDNNRLTQLPNADTPGYRHVVQLHASNNSLTEVLAINLPKNLTLLDVSHNGIHHLNATTLSVLNASQITVALAGNPWICDCTVGGLLDFVLLNNKILRDVEQMRCVDGRKFQVLSLNAICSNHNLVIAACVVIAVFSLCAGIIGVLYYKYQQQIKVWLYARGMCLWFFTEENLDKDKQYDAFISYSHKDEEFIAEHLLPQLENGPTPFKLCLHSRDWVIGEFIPHQILRSVEESRRTIIVLSPNFIESIWARMEFRAAHSAALKERRARVIVILYGDVGNIGTVDPDLKAYLQMNTYVKWGDVWFWQKLRYAMPHPSRNARSINERAGTDNNLELVEQSSSDSPLTTPPDEQDCRHFVTNQ